MIEKFEEKVVERQILKASAFGQADAWDDFVADSCYFSYTQKAGLPEERYGAFCFQKPLRIQFTVKRVSISFERRSRFLLKVVGMLREWGKYRCPIEIKLNGKRIFKDFVFFENICKGWPANYFRLPVEVLKKGENTLEIANLSKGTPEENLLIVSSVEIIEKEPYKDFEIISCPEIVEKGSLFKVDLVVLRPHQKIKVQCDPGIHFRSMYHHTNILHYNEIKSIILDYLSIQVQI